MSGMPFTKMHGLGNDYVYVDACRERVDDPVALARAVSDRHRGVGADGLILLLPPADPAAADLRMRMWNADGSEAEMCGNGIRCVCKLAHDRGIVAARPMRVETAGGVRTLDFETDDAGRVSAVTVDMGAPDWTPDRVPVRTDRLSALHDELPAALRSDLVAEPQALALGNPHLVLFCGDVKAIPLDEIGPGLETHAAFPRRVNVHVVTVRARDEVTMRTWERGSGLTQACGTGASAVCAAGVRAGLTDRSILAHLPGGDLRLEWCAETDRVLMTGPATEVFTGVWHHA